MENALVTIVILLILGVILSLAMKFYLSVIRDTYRFFKNMNLEKIKNLFLGKFPDSPKLKNYWWHRLSLILSLLLASLFYFFAIAILSSLNGTQDSSMTTNIWSSAIALFLIGRFIPGILYRMTLFIIFGNKWNSER